MTDRRWFLIVPLVAALGALWRRWFGGWQGGKRWVKVIGLTLLLGPSFLLAGSSWVSLPAALLIASWIPGHTWSEGYGKLLVRYGPWHGAVFVGLALVLGLPALAYLPVAFLIPAYYWWAHGRTIGWPDDSDFIDGTVALAELASGATALGAFYLAVLI